MRTLKPLALLAVLLQAPYADAAERACSLELFQWELELTRVERASGDADVHEIIRALGTRARLRGGYRDPAYPKNPARIELVGSTDGDGMSVLAEKREP